MVALIVTVRGHRALRTVAIARHFHQDGTDTGSEHRTIDHIHDLRALRLRVVFEQHGGGSASVDGSDAIKAFALLQIRDAYGLHGTCGIHGQCQQ